MKFIPIQPDSSELLELEKNAVVQDVVSSVFRMYNANDRQPVEPWIAYLYVQGYDVLGTCAFKSPPQNGQVEIAYFVFPEYEGKGLGTFFASFLVAQARLALPQVTVTAQTLPENNASTRILERLNFEMTGELIHPEDGKVWQWLRR
ncbi:GNAT family N-acetyltransferase [Leptospira sp. 201903070]|jgi:[ribosomal protein S5]-alanine N-acetyltransferase|uniref:GNAT family N-acetyltransferase n=1 Tax=Leptospira ainlahdjerensis TaxID=2810033 RepID=A0ABS2UGU0_9LEPT|nr:GNAT family N-acetyltransferase [Leptospira ainlahdjerensis]MBM9579369.1 GNAT family N-acetyltransferase [Leptospira ainlahdjerensis]